MFKFIRKWFTRTQAPEDPDLELTQALKTLTAMALPTNTQHERDMQYVDWSISQAREHLVALKLALTQDKEITAETHRKAINEICDRWDQRFPAHKITRSS